MYRPDLSPFNFSPWTNPRFVSVGWLDEMHPFSKGEISPQTVERLFALCAKPTIKTRGFHECPFCPKVGKGKPCSRNGKTIQVGSGIIRVRGRKWMTYFAPDLIYHYVVEHGYQPPDDFVQAILHPRRLLTLDFFGVAAFICSFVGIILALVSHQSLSLWFFAPMVILVVVVGVPAILKGIRAKS